LLTPAGIAGNKLIVVYSDGPDRRPSNTCATLLLAIVDLLQLQDCALRRASRRQPSILGEAAVTMNFAILHPSCASYFAKTFIGTMPKSIGFEKGVGLHQPLLHSRGGTFACRRPKDGRF
jgi:hypothetical protein